MSFVNILGRGCAFLRPTPAVAQCYVLNKRLIRYREDDVRRAVNLDEPERNERLLLRAGSVRFFANAQLLLFFG